jgi:DNA repair exonuclease SbcCD nuclease subunit
MTIQYASDLHLEFADNAQYVLDHPILPAGDVLLLAGDITSLNHFEKRRLELDFFKRLSKQYKRVFWIAGNHELYRSWDAVAFGKPMQHDIAPNVSLVNNKVIMYAGVRFVFTTLWSAISDVEGLYIQPNMSDFHLIRYQGRLLTTGMYTNRLHEPALQFLEETFAQPTDVPTVVVSHHLPSLQCVHPRHKGSTLGPAFASDLDAHILRWQPDYWMYGHSHANMPPVTLGNTQILTNQLGYVGYNEHTGYRPDARVDV